MQSSIQVEDVTLNGGEIISRDGVRIDGLTGTVDGNGKYDFEVVEHGASGAFHLLINLRGIHVNKNFDGDKNYSLEEIRDVVARLLRKLHDGIRLGALTTKGFGLIAAENLTTNIYDFRESKDVVAWLTVEKTANKIDRFTGGTLQGTLFTTKLAYQKNRGKSTLKVHFEIRNATDAEAGLEIFLLRDLWLGRVALGGEKSVGRGTVSGISAQINFKGKIYKLGANGKVVSGSKTELENFAAALKNFAGGDGK